ncbi:MAG: D-alanyl-D-alanine carboxypeptidase [Roseibacillus sp.]|nr:D-alanyl-D-alanine carboxypeptidase [Roseibacillus sp.]
MSIASGPPLACLVLSMALVACVSPPGNPTVQQRPVTPPPPSIVTPQGTPPAVVAKRVIVVDVTSGRVLAAKNADERCAVASTQKLMTALLVTEAGSLNDRVVIQSSDTTVEPTKLYLQTGHTYTRGQLLKAILVRSANDASVALARDVAGSVTGFAQQMNLRARSLGMSNSNFLNPHGLTRKGQFSTARDIAKLARHVYQHASLRGLTNIREYNFVHNNGKVSKLTNTNKLLKRLPYANGMKTGTTRASGRCLVASGSLHGRTVITVVLGSTSRSIWKDSEDLLRWALESPQLIRPVMALKVAN